jgi:acetyl-CoA carboxylase, biotin carboxylase subunit
MEDRRGSMKKILIANRGEIAARIIRTCKEMEIEPVVIYSDADADLPYVKNANIKYNIGEPPVVKSYLNADKIIEIAKLEQVDAIHPGYGFLSENAEFARKIENANITFIGPKPETVELMGDKIRAREAMQKAGVPVVPGTASPIQDVEEAAQIANTIGYPVMVKASAGGGGIGMQKCDDESALRKAFTSSQVRAKAYFGNDDMFLEKFIPKGRHIEVQIVGDHHGNIVHLFERDCSIQRRHQKVIEETPSPFLSQTKRNEIAEAAIKAAKHVGYVNAGTVEFIVDENEEFYFLEMNTRLQVEHPVTELTTGIDIVRWQIDIAAGREISLSQSEIFQNGHSIEFRLYAENPVNFMPSPGIINVFNYPDLEGVRVDTGYASGSNVTPFYDPMIAKIITYGSTRTDAINKAKLFFAELKIKGIKHNGILFSSIIENQEFQKGFYTTDYLSRDLLEKINLN